MFATKTRATIIQYGITHFFRKPLLVKVKIRPIRNETIKVNVKFIEKTEIKSMRSLIAPKFNVIIEKMAAIIPINTKTLEYTT